MAKSVRMAVAVLLVVALAAATAEARNIKTTSAAGKDDAVVQPTTFPPFDRLGGGASPAFGGLPGSGSIPGFGGMPGGSSIPAFSMPGAGSIGGMPLFGSPGLGGVGGMPGSPAAGAVPEHAKQP
ncbi:hypothetical protein ACP4OV_008790 [Aristida adscensionis]